MKIIEVSHRFIPNKGGIENHVYQISKRLNHKVKIYSCDLEKKRKEKKIPKLDIKRVHSFHPFNTYFFSINLYIKLKKEKCDILHLHNACAMPALIAYYAMKGNYKKLFFTPHFHPDGSSLMRKILRKIYDPIQKIIFKNAEKIFCVSEYEKKELIKKFKINPKKLIMIYNGIDSNTIKSAKPHKLDQKIILYVGRFEKYKNIHYLIKMMNYLPNFQLKIIGSGPYEEKLRQMATNENIEILTNLSNQEVARWYKTCSVFVTLSDIEAFGITVIEALAAGKPVVVNDATALTEFADKFDYVKKINIHKKSLKELAELIEKTSKLEVKNIDLSDYNWDKITKKIEREIK